MSVKFIDENGAPQTAELEDMKYHMLARQNGTTFRQEINKAFPTRAGDPDAFSQICVSAGLRFKNDSVLGIPASNLHNVLKPEAATTNQTGGSYTSAPSVADSRVLYAPALVETVENSLRANTADAVAAFSALIGTERTVPFNKFEHAIVNYGGKKGPEDFEWKRSAQNAPPAVMLSITASDVTRTIPSVGIGMEVSDEAMMVATVDMIADPLERFFQIAEYNDWVTNLGLILSGDPDGFNSDMDDNTAALSSFTAKSLDTSIATAGVLTQEAWLKFLYHNSRYMTKTNIVTDFNGALAIENRTGRPTNVQNNSIDRMDVPFKISYPGFQDSVDVIVMPDGTWTANTLMALDNMWALEKVNSAFADYSAIEAMVMRRSTQMRVNKGSLLYRKYTKAFDVLTLTV